MSLPRFFGALGFEKATVEPSQVPEVAPGYQDGGFLYYNDVTLEQGDWYVRATGFYPVVKGGKAASTVELSRLCSWFGPIAKLADDPRQCEPDRSKSRSGARTAVLEPLSRFRSSLGPLALSSCHTPSNKGSHMKTQLLLLCLSTTFSIVLPACGTSSPDAYIEKSTTLACKYAKKCEEAMWEEAGFESISDCRDQLLDTNLGTEGTLRDQFVEGCTDFDSGAARKCLAAARKAKRGCDDLAEVDEPACNEVCGTPEVMGQGLADPMTDELVARALEQLVENGELELEPEGELTVD